MNTKPAKRRSLHLPLITALLLFVPLGIYYFSYVPSKKVYFTDRNLRLLSDMSDQIASKIENYKNVIDNAASTAMEDLPQGVEDKAEKLSMARENVRAAIALVPNLMLIEEPTIALGEVDLADLQSEGGAAGHHHGEDIAGKDLPAAITPDAESHAHPSVVRGESRAYQIALHLLPENKAFWAHFDYKGHFDAPPGGKESGRRAAYTATIHTKSNLNDIVTPIIRRGIFDEVLLTGWQGNVVYQLVRSELVASRIDTLAMKPALIQSSRVLDLRLAGASYKLFLQPVRLSFRREPGSDESIEWALCGLIRTDRFTSEALAISYTNIIIFACLILVLILSWPLLKLWHMGPKDRIRSLDALSLAIVIPLATAILTFVLLDFIAYQQLSKNLDDQLETLAGQISRNFLAEMELAHRELQDISKAFAPSPPARAFEKHTSVLREKQLGSSIYPYFDLVAWIDAGGQQKYKWTVKKERTPLINVGKRAYFRKLADGQAWARAFNGAMQTPFWIEPIYSWNTGEYRAVLSIPATDNTPGNVSNIIAAGMSLRPISIIQPVLPAGLGFAIIEADGNVLFHADERRNLRENFFKECDNDRLLRAAVFAQTEEFVNTDYLGRGHRLFIKPLREVPWTLIVFRDELGLRTANLNLLSLAFLLLVFFALLIIALLALLLLISPKGRFAWFWPDNPQRGRYIQLLIANAVLSVLFLEWVLSSHAWQIIYMNIIIPLMAITLAYLRLTTLDEGVRGNWKIVATIFVLLFAALMSISLLHVENFSQGLASFPGGHLWQTIYRGFSLLLIVFFLMSPRATAFSRRMRVLNFRQAYVLATVSLLFLCSILPSLSFFKVAYEEESELMVRHGQFTLARALAARAARIKADYLKISLPNRAEFLKQRADLRWDIYSSAAWQTTATLSAGGIGRIKSPAANDRQAALYTLFKERLAHLRFLYNETAVESRELIHDRLAGSKIVWERRHDQTLMMHQDDFLDRGGLHISSVVPAIDLSRNRTWWLGPIAVLALGFLVIRFVAKRLLLIEFEPLPDLSFDAIARGRLTQSMFILGSPEYHQKGLFLKTSVFHHLDLARYETAQAFLADCTPQKLPKGKVIVLDHFEYLAGDRDWDEARLQITHRLVQVEHRKIVIISTLDPINYFSLEEQGIKPGGEAERHALLLLNRWAAVLGSFRRLYLEDSGHLKTFEQRLEAGRQRRLKALARRAVDSPGQVRKHIEEIYRVLREECGATGTLQAIGLEMSRLAGLVRLSRAELISQIESWAEPYYRAIWANSSRMEKMVLIHLAKHGFVNANNLAIVQILMRKRVIRRKPSFRIMNASFRRFVLSTNRPAEIAEWEREGESSYWDRMQAPLLTILLGVALFIFATQREVFDTTIALVSAFTASIPAVMRFFGLFQLGRAGSKSDKYAD